MKKVLYALIFMLIVATGLAERAVQAAELSAPVVEEVGLAPRIMPGALGQLIRSSGLYVQPNSGRLTGLATGTGVQWQGSSGVWTRVLVMTGDYRGWAGFIRTADIHGWAH